MSELLQLDEYLFELLNREWRHPFLDTLLPYWRNKLTWLPLYFFLLLFLYKKLKSQIIYLLIGVSLTLGIADFTSSQLIKNSVERIRPCNQTGFKHKVRLIVPCGSGYSFTSSHATNHFALVTFLIMALGQLFKSIRLPLWLWAISIAYAQVYVGVHYPGDVLGGAILGCLIGWFGAMGFKHFLAFKIRNKNS